MFTTSRDAHHHLHPLHHCHLLMGEVAEVGDGDGDAVGEGLADLNDNDEYGDDVDDYDDDDGDCDDDLVYCPTDLHFGFIFVDVSTYKYKGHSRAICL